MSSPQYPLTAYIGLGSNLGDSRTILMAAVAEINRYADGRVIAVSSLYQSHAAEVLEAQPDYLNAVIALSIIKKAHTPIDIAHHLLSHLQAIEQKHGRTRTHWHSARTLDLDLLMVGSLILKSETLTLPHPRMHNRDFVMIPLHEIAPSMFPLSRATLPTLKPIAPPSWCDDTF